MDQLFRPAERYPSFRCDLVGFYLPAHTPVPSVAVVVAVVVVVVVVALVAVVVIVVVIVGGVVVVLWLC